MDATIQTHRQTLGADRTAPAAEAEQRSTVLQPPYDAHQRLNKDGRINWDLECVDGGSVRMPSRQSEPGERGPVEAAEAAEAPRSMWTLMARVCHWRNEKTAAISWRC
jgi:hypothetical protein